MGRIHEQPVGTLTDESTLLFEQLNGATWNSKSIAWSNIKSQIAASGFITNTVSNLTNYYLKSETYTQTEVNALISAINTGRFEVVQTLPATGEAKVIYLVPKDPGETQNVYDEYIYINNAWEKIGDTEIDLDRIESEIEDLQDITSTEKITTAESNPVQLTTQSAQNALSCVVKMDATQDLHGYDKPWSWGSGKNLLNPTGASDIQYGISVSKDSQGRYTATGTSTRSSANAFLAGEFDVENGTTYILNGCPIGGGANSYRLDVRTTPTTIYNSTLDFGNGATFTADADLTLYVYIRFAGNYAISGSLIFKPMLRLATESDPTFEPYSNICPITGHDEVSVIVKDGNNVTRKTIDIDLEQTIYGGAVDAVSGQLTQTHAYIASYNGESINEPWISSMDEYVAGTVPSIGAEVVYPLSTPNLYDIDSSKIPLLEGVNTVSTDGTSVRLVYRDGVFATLEDLKDILDQQEEIIRIQNKLIKDMAEMLEQFVGAEGVEERENGVD